MPKRRPMEFLRRLGARIRSRRMHLKRPRLVVAQGAEISIAQLSTYESGQGHPPAATLHRIALVLGTTTSALLGETSQTDNTEQVDEMMRIYADPVVGAVIRYMQDMTADERKSLRVIAAKFARTQDVETAEVMR